MGHVGTFLRLAVSEIPMAKIDAPRGKVGKLHGQRRLPGCNICAEISLHADIADLMADLIAGLVFRTNDDKLSTVAKVGLIGQIQAERYALGVHRQIALQGYGRRVVHRLRRGDLLEARERLSDPLERAQA